MSSNTGLELSIQRNWLPLNKYISNVFDTPNFDIFLDKLQNYGVNGVPPVFIKIYLNERYQYTNDNFDSMLLEIKTGIPQGSILGPLFFSV